MAGVRRSAHRLVKSFDFSLVNGLDFEIEKKGGQQRSIESRARLVAVACEAFLDRSYDSVSTHDIAAQAGVAQGLVTYHFGSKEGLWQAAMDNVFGDFRNTLARRLRELEAAGERERLEAIIRQVVRLERGYPSIARLMVDGGGHVDNARLAWLLKRHIQPIYDVITHLFEVGQANGLLRPVPLANAYYILFTAGSIFLLENEVKLVAGLDVKARKFEQAQADCLVGMLLVG